MSPTEHPESSPGLDGTAADAGLNAGATQPESAADQPRALL